MYHTQSKHANTKSFVVKTGISHIIVKLPKLVCVFAIGAVPIHDVATREKHLLGSDLAFMHFCCCCYYVGAEFYVVVCP